MKIWVRGKKKKDGRSEQHNGRARTDPLRAGQCRALALGKGGSKKWNFQNVDTTFSVFRTNEKGGNYSLRPFVRKLVVGNRVRNRWLKTSYWKSVVEKRREIIICGLLSRNWWLETGSEIGG